MAKVARILFINTHYDSGVPKYVAGQHYPVNEETSRCVLQGAAEQIEVDMKVNQAEDKANNAANDEKIIELRAAIEKGKTDLLTAQTALEDNREASESTRLANRVAEVKNNLGLLQDQLAILQPA